MALKHVKNYYQQVEKMYLDLASSLQEMEEDFKAGKVTEDELNNLMLPVKGLKENYVRLSYIMYLLAQPNRESKKENYFKNNSALNDFFGEEKLSVNEDFLLSQDALKEFKKRLEELKDKK